MKLGRKLEMGYTIVSGNKPSPVALQRNHVQHLWVMQTYLSYPMIHVHLTSSTVVFIGKILINYLASTYPDGS